jgi:polar amino acid transport system substrate-binding protein
MQAPLWGNRTLVQRRIDTTLSAVEHDSPLTKMHSLPRGAFSFSKANPLLRKAFDEQLLIYLGTPDHRRRMAQYGLTAGEIDMVPGR